MTIKLRRRNKITLPDEVIEQLGVKEWDDFSVEITGWTIDIDPAVLIPQNEGIPVRMAGTDSGGT